jgi:hypothetical protein
MLTSAITIRDARQSARSRRATRGFRRDHDPGRAVQQG